MKQIYLSILLLFLPITVNATESVSINGIRYILNEENQLATVSNGEEYNGNIVIPNSIIYNGDSYKVSSIGDYAFQRCYSLTSVTIPNSVTSIGRNAFFDCYSLTSVTIPNSVISIGEGAFGGCGLTSLTIPNSVTSIGRYAFHGTPWFLNQSDGLVYAGKVAYSYKGTMPENTKIELKEGTIGIAECAFLECWSLISVDIPNSVICIGSSAFENCGNLISVIIPNSVTSIEDYTFQGCI